MAAKTSASIGVGITITVLGLVSLALFILTIVFLSKFQNADRQLKQAQADQAEIVRPDERNSDVVQRLKDEAKKSGNKSLVGYLADSLRTISTRVAGTPGDTPEQLLAKVDAFSPTASLSEVVRNVQGERDALAAKLEQSDRDRQGALDSLKAESDRVAALTESHRKTIEGLNAELGRYRDEVEGYRKGVTDAKASLDASLERERGDFATREASFQERIKKLEAENLQLIERVGKLQADKSKDILKPQSEAALVDGSIVSLDAAAGTVTIDRGRRDKVFLGMSFAVYSDPTAIKPDPRTGEYPQGKATIEVIRVDETSSTCRITREVRGNPLVRGDVIANALYDPAKVYTFLIYGTFDANGDGRPTAAESDTIRALVRDWGGTSVDDLSGNVDFVVLGQRPQVPPQPAVGAPFAVVQEYIRLEQAAQRYDQLFREAVATSLPVLNENRLYTLIGKQR